MVHPSLPALLALALPGAALPGPVPSDPVSSGAFLADDAPVTRRPVQGFGDRAPPPPTRLRIEERVVIRIPRVVVLPSPALPVVPPATRWKEKKGPRCLATDALAGALIANPGTIDLVMAGGGRFRAELGDDCPTLGFYSGFYLKPSRDGQVCADRDSVRARSGRACPIRRFRRLQPRR